jgi:hypothetical protein
LIQGQLVEVDQNPQTLGYYNSANPSQPLSGPGNSGATQNTIRRQSVNLSVVAGAPATTGSQTIPAATPGCVPLWDILLANGTTTITSSNITRDVNSPSLPITLPNNGAGYRNRVLLTGSGNYVFPYWVRKARVTRIGGGGGGANCLNNGGANDTKSGGGGGAGATEIDDINVSPGQSFSYSQGLGGGAQAAGTATTFGGLAAAQPGNPGTTGGGSSPGGQGGAATATGFSGGDGSDGQTVGTNTAAFFAGNGGASSKGGGGRSAHLGAGLNGRAPGSGGGGARDMNATGVNIPGGSGANGMIMVEF